MVRRWGDTGRGRGRGRGRASLFQEGVVPGLEAVQGVSRHDLLRQKVQSGIVLEKNDICLYCVRQEGMS